MYLYFVFIRNFVCVSSVFFLFSSHMYVVVLYVYANVMSDESVMWRGVHHFLFFFSSLVEVYVM